MQPQTQKPFLLLLTMLILCSITTKPAQSQGQKRPNSTDRPETLSLDFWKMEFTRQNPLAPTLSNVAYGPDKQQVLEFWQAPSDVPTPLVFFIHGGAWRANDKDRVSGLHAYLAAGISVVSINYRFIQSAATAGVNPPLIWPMQDSARALQFVRSKAAEWNIDKERIGASGGSAGACTSLWLAFHDDMAKPDSSDPIARESTRVSCAGLVGAQTSLDPAQMRTWIPNIAYGGPQFGFAGDKSKKLSSFQEFLNNRDKMLPWINKYSPYGLVTSDDPPIHIFYTKPPAMGKKQGNATHSANFGMPLQEKMRSLGIECHIVYPGTPDREFADPVQFLISQLETVR